MLEYSKITKILAQLLVNTFHKWIETCIQFGGEYFEHSIFLNKNLLKNYLNFLFNKDKKLAKLV